MPCPFTGPKMFWACTNFLCQTKNLFTFCGSHKHFVPDKKLICIQQNWFLCQQKRFWRGTKFLGWLKIFGQAQNVLGPVKGQGISLKFQKARTKIEVVLRLPSWLSQLNWDSQLGRLRTTSILVWAFWNFKLKVPLYSWNCSLQCTLIPWSLRKCDAP